MQSEMNESLVTKNYLIAETPVLACFNQAVNTSKPLVILSHGFRGSKNDLKDKLEIKNNEINSLHVEIEGKNHDIETLNQDIELRNRIIEEIKEQLTTNHLKLLEKNNILTDIGAELTRKKEEVYSLQKELEVRLKHLEWRNIKLNETD